MRLAGKSIGLAAFMAALGSSASPAAAAVVSGSNLGTAPNSSICVTPSTPIDCTVTIGELPAALEAPGGPQAAIDGVIVDWRVRAGTVTYTSQIRLRVVHGIQGGGFGPTETLPKEEGVYEFPARVPVRAGDAIGLDMPNVALNKAVPIFREFAFGATLDIWSPLLAEGEDRAPTVDDNEDVELLLNATIEPDADGDGYGDESQDACPSAPNGGAACPPPVPPAPGDPVAPVDDFALPQTKIDGGPKGKIRVARATFRFSSSRVDATFQCKLDKKPFKQCSSPRTYKGLGEGRHKFEVRAVSPNGRTDPTPAKRPFKVES